MFRRVSCQLTAPGLRPSEQQWFCSCTIMAEIQKLFLSFHKYLLSVPALTLVGEESLPRNAAHTYTPTRKHTYMHSQTHTYTHTQKGQSPGLNVPTSMDLNIYLESELFLWAWSEPFTAHYPAAIKVRLLQNTVYLYTHTHTHTHTHTRTHSESIGRARVAIQVVARRPALLNFG